MYQECFSCSDITRSPPVKHTADGQLAFWSPASFNSFMAVLLGPLWVSYLWTILFNIAYCITVFRLIWFVCLLFDSPGIGYESVSGSDSCKLYRHIVCHMNGIILAAVSSNKTCCHSVLEDIYKYMLIRSPNKRHYTLEKTIKGDWEWKGVCVCVCDTVWRI